MRDKNKTTKTVINISTILGFVILIAYVTYCINQGIFSSRDALNSYILRIGIWGAIFFILIQAIQVVIPILPGAIGCVVGVIAFGPTLGFIYNYIGICIGSIIAFLLSKTYGISLLESVANPKTLKKYMGWLEEGKKFDKLFTFAIFMPVAPDDFLCFLAGVTSMSLKKFVTIILCCKPCSIFLYSMGLTGITSFINYLR